MYLRDFLQNPSGKSSAMFYNRGLAIKSMENKLNNYVTIKNSRGSRVFNYTIYKHNDSFIFKFLLPSENYTNLAYDVFLKFDPPPAKSSSLANYSVTFFSNSPAFTFTYTYVLNKMGLLFNDMKKCNKLALTKAPEIRNPVEILGFEKSIYVCGLFIMKKKQTLMDVDYLTRNSTKWKIREISKTVRSDNEKLKEYNIMKKKFNLNQKNEKLKKLNKQRAEAETLRNKQKAKRNARKNS